MFVLDTNVLSAVMGNQPVPEAAAWMSAQPEARLFTTSVCKAEILAGVGIMAEGQRRRLLETAAKAIFGSVFDGRVLPFDDRAAEFYAEIFAAHRSAGRPMGTADIMIASIARAHGAALVTRNTADFLNCGLTLVNPWVGEA